VLDVGKCMCRGVPAWPKTHKAAGPALWLGTEATALTPPPAHLAELAQRQALVVGDSSAGRGPPCLPARRHLAFRRKPSLLTVQRCTAAFADGECT